MPKRTIKPSHFSVTGYFPSAKNGGVHQAESSLEQDFMMLLEFDDCVARYGVQPITNHWKTDEGHLRKYTPDVVVLYHMNLDLSPKYLPTLFEVKPASDLKHEWTKMKPKYRAAMAWARANGFRFKFITDKQIRTSYLDNVRFLTRYSERAMPQYEAYDPTRHLLLRETLRKIGVSTPRQLIESASSDKSYQLVLIPMLWQMMHIGVIQADLHKPLNMKSPIWLKVRD